MPKINNILPMPTVEENLKSATEIILTSPSRKKLIVAGPGAGKTFIFTRLLENLVSHKNSHLVLTFINTLKDDLDKSLSHLAKVYTLHGFCNSLLHNSPALRIGLREDFNYYPSLATLILKDWSIIYNGTLPKFIQLMRELTINEDLTFYINRANFYNAISFDDSVFRVYKVLNEAPEHISLFNLILIDEFQDFNSLEAALIQQLAQNSPIVIAGDDDQALYGNLRSARHDFIRSLHSSTEYDNFELPYCMRCTEVVVNAINDVINRARSEGLLQGRIEKTYQYYPPSKGRDSELYPLIDIVECTTQSRRDNYMGRYIIQAINLIPLEEIKESHEKGFPTVLIIAPKQYLDQIEPLLDEQSYTISKSNRDEIAVRRESGIEYLKIDPESNLGWRIVVEVDNPEWKNEVINKSFHENSPLSALIPIEYKQTILAEVELFTIDTLELEQEAEVDTTVPTVKLVSYEGSKGLSAQHVFIMGLQENELPRHSSDIKDIEICKFLVALTRTRKKCHILTTFRFSGQSKRPSAFLS